MADSGAKQKTVAQAYLEVAVDHGVDYVFGLPGTSGFVGEFMVILGSVRTNVWYAVAAATALVFGAAYTLWMYKRVMFGAVANRHVAALSDLDGRERLVLGLLAALVLVMGLWPNPFADVLHTSVNDLLAHVAQSKLR